MRFALSLNSWKTVDRSLTFEEYDERLRAGWFVDVSRISRASPQSIHKNLVLLRTSTAQTPLKHLEDTTNSSRLPVQETAGHS